MKMIALALALTLSACSLTVEDREAIRETGLNLATVAVEALQTVGLNPLEDADPKLLQYANAGCVILAASSPTIVQVINRMVDSANEGLVEGDQTERTTVEEFTAGLEAVCTVIRQVLEPVVTVAPEAAA